MINNIETRNKSNKEYHTPPKEELIDILQKNNYTISVQLWRSEQREMWKIQNIQIYLDEKLIVDSDRNNQSNASENLWFIYVVINETDKKLLIASNNTNDIRYIGKNQWYVGNVYIPKLFRGKWVTAKIYQEIANELGIEIVKWDTISIESQFFWKKQSSFKPNR